MLIKKLLTVISITIFSFSTLVYANSNVSDSIKMNTPEYKKHTKGLVVFNHKNHYSNYDIKCGECHHDSKGQQLELKKGDSVDRCIVCHEETKPSPKEEKLSKKEKIKKYHKVAIHTNCKSCHKKNNKKNDSKDRELAPVKCKECHPKSELK